MHRIEELTWSNNLLELVEELTKNKEYDTGTIEHYEECVKKRLLNDVSKKKK